MNLAILKQLFRIAESETSLSNQGVSSDAGSSSGDRS
jgi:hypothetical protein